MADKNVLEQFENEDGVINYEAYRALKDMMKTPGWEIFKQYGQAMINLVNEDLTEPAYREGNEAQGLPPRTAIDGMLLKEFRTGEMHGAARILSWPESAVISREDSKEQSDGTE